MVVARPAPMGPVVETAMTTIWLRIEMREQSRARLLLGDTPRLIISPKHVRPRAQVFYVRLIIPKYSRRGSPASQRRIGDAHQTAWHGCGDSHLGGTRPCGRGLRSSEPRKARLSHRGEYPAGLVDRNADLARGRYLDVPRELDTARHVCGGGGAGGAGPSKDADPPARGPAGLPPA